MAAAALPAAAALAVGRSGVTLEAGPGAATGRRTAPAPTSYSGRYGAAAAGGVVMDGGLLEAIRAMATTLNGEAGSCCRRRASNWEPEERLATIDASAVGLLASAPSSGPFVNDDSGPCTSEEVGCSSRSTPGVKVSFWICEEVPKV